MNIGLYAAYLGMRARQRNLDTIANNIANASTAGFKADHLAYRLIESGGSEANGEAAPASGITSGPTSDPSAAAPNATGSAQANENTAPATPSPGSTRHAQGILAEGATDFAPGSIRETGRSLDIALGGNGFLVVQTPRGERYTRAGSLTLDAAGQLTTQRGDLVVGDGGPITIPPGEAMIGADGSISVKGQTIGRLKLVQFTNPRTALAKEGDSLFVATGTERPREATETRVEQGALEMSNVSPMSELVAMMQNNREFDSLQRSVTMLMNDLGRKVSNEIGKI